MTSGLLTAAALCAALACAAGLASACAGQYGPDTLDFVLVSLDEALKERKPAEAGAQQ